MTTQKLILPVPSSPILLAMLVEDTSYTPLSSEPIDLAQRLRGYIEGLFTSADRDKEDPPWFVSLCSREAKPHIERAAELNSEHPTSDRAGAGASSLRDNSTEQKQNSPLSTSEVQDNITKQLRKQMKLRPHMQRWLIKATLNHVLRLEYHLRCFILFLTAQIIEMGRAGEPPEPRAPGTPRGLTYAQRQDQEMREDGRELPRLNSFKVLTPVIENPGRRKYKRRIRPYLMAPDDLKVIDAGHVFARLKRLEHVLANADKFAMSLACRAVAQIPELSEKKSPLRPQGGEGVGGEVGFSTISVSPSSQTLLPEGEGPKQKHPLYFAPLANFCPPEDHYDSAPDPEQKRDFNLIHWLASSRLEQIGLGVRPDPYRGLPDLSCLDPKPPPRISSL